MEKNHLRTILFYQYDTRQYINTDLNTGELTQQGRDGTTSHQSTSLTPLHSLNVSTILFGKCGNKFSTN